MLKSPRQQTPTIEMSHAAIQALGSHALSARACMHLGIRSIRDTARLLGESFAGPQGKTTRIHAPHGTDDSQVGTPCRRERE